MKTHFFSISLVLFLASSFLTKSQSPTNGVMGYWPFNGNANDLSGNNNNGTVYGATLTNDRFGNPNSAYHFDGTNYISILNSVSLNPQNSISLCAWYKSESFYGAGYSAIIDKGFTSHSAPTYQYKLGAGGSYASKNNFGFSVTDNNLENRIVTSDQYWTAGNWYFLAGTYDGTNMKFYVNNQLIQSIPLTGLLSNYNTPVYFGNNTTISDFVTGVIDDIRIYNRALEPGELTALYNESGPTPTGLNSQQKETSFSIYPNPSLEDITIGSNKFDHLIREIKITNSLGQFIYQSVDANQTITVSRNVFPSAGIYFVHVTAGADSPSEIRKLIIQ